MAGNRSPSLPHGALARLGSLDINNLLAGLRKVPLGYGALLALLLLGAVGLSQLLQERMARHLVEKVLESQKIKIRDRVTGFDGTLAAPAGSVGHDMRVSRLLGRLLDTQDASHESFSRPLYVATTEGQVLAQREGTPSKAERVPQDLWSKLAPVAGSKDLAVLPNGSNYLVVAPITTLRALAVCVVDGGWVRQTVAEELGVLQLAEGLFILVAVGSVLGLAVKDAQGRLQRQVLLEERNQDLERLSRIDQLTNLHNRFGLQAIS